MTLKISATKAKNQFGAICALAKQEPVLVEKDGRPDTVILSTSLYEELLKNQQKSQESEKEASKRFAKAHSSLFLLPVKQCFQSIYLKDFVQGHYQKQTLSCYWLRICRHPS